MIIVDNTKDNYELQKDNGIEIKSYYGFDSKKMNIMEDDIILDEDKCLVELAYIIGVAKPASVYINTYNTNKIL